MKTLGKVLKEVLNVQPECETDHCGGMKHCKNRMCNPADVDCRECLDDSEKAIEEAIRNRGNPNWP
jgi:hypothetical protein